MADVEGPWDRRSPKGQGLLRKEGPPKYANLVDKLSIVAIYALYERPPKSFLRKSSYFESVFNERQLAFEGHSTKVSQIS